MGKKTWEDWELQVLRDYWGKLPIEEIVELLPDRTVAAVHLKAGNIGLMPKLNSWTEAEDQILRDNLSLLTHRQIAELLPGRTKRAVRARIAKIGMSGEQWACKHSANRQFFAEPNILNCYWAGLIAADGCIGTSRKTSSKTLSISLIEPDRYLLERFTKDTEFTGRVSARAGYSRAVNAQPSAYISISCAQEWFSDLERHFSITPRKSLTLKPPNGLSKECALAFIKGFFDGNGCVYFDRTGYMTIGFAGAKRCLDWIKSICDEVAPPYRNNHSRQRSQVLRRGKICTYTIGGHCAETLAKEILTLDIPGMHRKWDRIQAYLAEEEQRVSSISTPVDVYILNPSKVFLGRLCKRGHNYQESGKTLRWKVSSACIKCTHERRGVTPTIPVRHSFEMTAQLYPEIDTSISRLGPICLRGHDYNNTGYSLRRASNGMCIECDRERSKNNKVKNLGRLCSRGHNYNNTGFSLRRASNGACIECERWRRHQRS